MEKLLGTYAGTVEKVTDPERLGRVKVRVPHVYGGVMEPDGLTGIATDDLPWALPAGLPAGHNHGISWLPDVGDHVWVRFLDGEPEKPLWEWGMQDRVQRNSPGGEFQSYSKSTPGELDSAGRELAQDTVKGVKSALFRRYGHSFDISPSSVIATTGQGYSLLLNDSSLPGLFDGSIQLSTPLGQFVELNDLDQFMTVFSQHVHAEILFDVVVQAAEYTVTSMTGGLLLTTATSTAVNAAGPIALASSDAGLFTASLALTLAGGTLAVLKCDPSIITLTPTNVNVDTITALVNLTDITVTAAGFVLANATGPISLNTSDAGLFSAVAGLTLSGGTTVVQGGGRTMTMAAGVTNFT